jgi:hypothetical protein
LDHDVCGLKARNLIERIVQYIEERAGDFDDYMPCRGGV